MFGCSWTKTDIRDEELESTGGSGGTEVGRIIKEQNSFDIKRTWNPENTVLQEHGIHPLMYFCNICLPCRL